MVGFQFLMVRLKVSVTANASGITCISIPYGSIKSLRSRTSSKSSLKFQFLMVRLKAAYPLTIPNCIFSISIPYGSIKRTDYYWQIPVFHISIPYGSIKSSMDPVSWTKPPCISIPYGSIKRTVSLLAINCFNVISIPYGSIKSYTHVGSTFNERYFNSLWFD